MNQQPTSQQIEGAYALAHQRYAEFGVDAEAAMSSLAAASISLHCWQGDDVGGFENAGAALGGGLAVTGNYPGKASNADELRQDLDLVYSLIPGRHRLNLHAIYAETGGKRAERTELLPEHFSRWLDWAKANGHGLDFNPTCFAHPMAASGFTLSSYNPAVRRFWIEHCRACRRIGAYFGRELGSACVTNLWIPDGMKDSPADRLTPRLLLRDSLDQVFAEKLDRSHNLDAVEGKLFGIGAESYTVGSHEFYLGYALSRGLLLCLDSGHFHPTETIADKLSSVLSFMDEILLHISRGVRWDSDHVLTQGDDLLAIMQELARNDYLGRVHIGLDYFDASINRLAAWVIGARNALRALLIALLEPAEMLRDYERRRDYTARLALQEEAKGLPFNAVWDEYCRRQNAPVGFAYLEPIKAYEASVLAQRR